MRRVFLMLLSIFHGPTLAQSLPATDSELVDELREFCKTNEIRTDLSGNLLGQIESLHPNLRKLERYHNEREVIAQMTLEDVTALELWACHPMRQASRVQYSVARILNAIYAENWQDFLSSDKHLRCYLKKSKIFLELSDYRGIAKRYLNVFTQNPEAYEQRLGSLLAVESDGDIKAQLSFLLVADTADSESNQKLESFLRSPDEFRRANLREIHLCTGEHYEAIVARIQERRDPANLYKYLFVLSRNLSLQMAPFIFPLLEDHRIYLEGEYIGLESIFGPPLRSRREERKREKEEEKEKERVVSVELVKMLEELFSHSFKELEYTADQALKRREIAGASANHWHQMWLHDSVNYSNWDSQFYADKVEWLANSDWASVSIINAIIGSTNFSSNDKGIVLSALQKLTDSNDVSEIHFNKKFDVSDFERFGNLHFSHWKLEHLHKEVTFSDSADFWRFIVRQIQYNEDPVWKGYTYDGLLYYDPFVHWLTAINREVGELRAEIIRSLDARLEDLHRKEHVIDAYIKSTLRHKFLVQHFDQSTEENIKLTLSIPNKAARKEIMGDILATASYENLSVVLRYYDALDTLDLLHQFDVEHYVGDELGIPLSILDEPKEFWKDDLRPERIDTLLQQHSRFSELEFYKHYATKLHPKLLDSNKVINYDEAYFILKYGQTNRFVGAGPVEGRAFVIPVIRILELEFETRLGYRRNFYFDSNNERPLKWADYLQEHGLVTALASPHLFQE